MRSLLSYFTSRPPTEKGVSSSEAAWYELTSRSIAVAVVGGFVLTFVWYGLWVGKELAADTLAPWQELASSIAILTSDSPAVGDPAVSYLRQHSRLAYDQASTRPDTRPFDGSIISEAAQLKYAWVSGRVLWTFFWGLATPNGAEDGTPPQLYFTVSRVLYKDKKFDPAKASLNVGTCKTWEEADAYLRDDTNAFGSYSLTVNFDIASTLPPHVISYQKMICLGAIPLPQELLLRSPVLARVPTQSYDMLHISSIWGVVRPTLIANNETLAVEDYLASFPIMASQYCEKCDTKLQFVLEQDDLAQARDKAFLIGLLESLMSQDLGQAFVSWRRNTNQDIPSEDAMLAATLRGNDLESAIGWLRRFNGSDDWGLIQFLTTVAAWTLAILLLFRVNLLVTERRESRQLRVDPQLNRHQEYWLEYRDKLHQKLAEKHDRGHRVPYMLDLMYTGLNVWAKSGSTTDAVSQVKARAESINDRLQSVYDLLKDLLVVITGIGFFGTVIGIGLSLGDAGGVLTNIEVDKMRVISSLTNSLGISFDTTIVALLFFIVLSAWISVLDRLERKTINEAECDVQDALVSLTGKTAIIRSDQGTSLSPHSIRALDFSLLNDTKMLPGILAVFFSGGVLALVYGFLNPHSAIHALSLHVLDALQYAIARASVWGNAVLDSVGVSPN